ncbi:hypothetical protein MIZ03_4763 [Rhodoferax lithotrophicus]|uniref:Uncharacterized protein n=1 Tax=Rhodoferax lithotrophicus TaxID=2798804 RepID=A0ABN6DFP8_9BURK|nr:hypothetical protein MIZ03_4763 [Rhodoferax sp. MIZ03]
MWVFNNDFHDLRDHCVAAVQTSIFVGHENKITCSGVGLLFPAGEALNPS